MYILDGAILKLTGFLNMQLVAGQHPCTIQAATKEWLDQPDMQPLRDADTEGKRHPK